MTYSNHEYLQEATVIFENLLNSFHAADTSCIMVSLKVSLNYK